MNFTKDEIMYSQIYEILHLLGKEYTDKLPKDLIKVINESRNPNYIIEFDLDKEISDQVSDETIDFFAYLNLIYWSNPAEKEKLKNIYTQNEISQEKEKNEKYSYDKIFEKRQEIQEPATNQTENALLEINNSNIFFINLKNKFINFIKKILHRNI